MLTSVGLCAIKDLTWEHLMDRVGGEIEESVRLSRNSASRVLVPDVIQSRLLPAGFPSRSAACCLEIS